MVSIFEISIPFDNSSPTSVVKWLKSSMPQLETWPSSLSADCQRDFMLWAQETLVSGLDWWLWELFMELQSWDQPWSLRYWKHVVLETIFLNVHFSNLEASYSFRNRLLATFLLGTPHLPVLLVEQVWTFPLWWRPLSSGYSFQRPLYWLQAAWVSSVLPNLWWVICLPLQCHRFVNNNLSKTLICLWLFDLDLLRIVFSL